MAPTEELISVLEQQRLTQFREKLDAALVTVRNVLDSNKRVVDPASTSHTYDDKFTLVTHLSNVALNAIGNALEPLGLTSAVFDALSVAARDRQRPVLLTFDSKWNWEFDREVTREIKFPTVSKTVTESVAQSETTSLPEVTARTETTRKVATKSTTYLWKFSYTYELACSIDREIFFNDSRTRTLQLKTSTQKSRRTASSVRPSASVNLTWLAVQWSPEQHGFEFSIDRSAPSCHTPRRNDDVYEVVGQLEQLKLFCKQVLGFYRGHLENSLLSRTDVHQRPSTRAEEVSEQIFRPVVALFDEATSTVLRIEDADKLIGEHVASIASAIRHLDASFQPPESAVLISSAEARIMALMTHTCSLITQYLHSVQYVEDMLSQQLVAAIGKELSVRGFAEYMRFHNNRKLLKPEYALTPFCHAVVRPEHTPEGLISMETSDGDVICTSVRGRRTDPRKPMTCAINAATTVNIAGTHYVHGWLDHTFASAPADTSKLTLVARARQFSSYIVLLGTVSSATDFQAKHAVILQNRDDLRIPLFLDEIPTPKAFRDAIESLSPEQKRFARAYRAMQLESSLFVCCVVQIKPALERLLRLAPDSLTKEIKLTQDLMDLFIQYQIPSDLISFGGDDSTSAADRLEAVRKHVSGMYDMVTESKQRELAEAREKQQKIEADARERQRKIEAEYALTPVVRQCAALPNLVGDTGVILPKQRRSAPTARAEICENPTAEGDPAPRPDRTAEPARAVASAIDDASEHPKDFCDATEHPEDFRDATEHPEDFRDATEHPEDYTRLPVALNHALETIDEDAAVRPTIIKVGRTWTKRVQRGLLSPPQKITFTPEHQETARNQTFDLLDALSRSGLLCLEEAEFHIMVAATHRFDRTLLDTVIQQNTNPIEKVERSVLIMASTVHQVEASQLIRAGPPSQRAEH